MVSENFSVNELPAGGVEEQQGFVAHLDESVREATRQKLDIKKIS